MTVRTDRCPRNPSDPANMTAEQRVAEVAAILAEGLLRLRRSGVTFATSVSAEAPQISLESGEIGLELSPDLRLHGHGG